MEIVVIIFPRGSKHFAILYVSDRHEPRKEAGELEKPHSNLLADQEIWALLVYLWKPASLYFRTSDFKKRQ